jgi:hypothetical protein
MLVRKPPVASPPVELYQKELEDLYARRVVIDTLIRSLVDYDRLRIQRMDTLKEKTA